MARILPTTKAFAALRKVLDGGDIPWSTLAGALAGSVVFFLLAAMASTWLLSVFRRRGFVTRYS